MVGPRQSFLFSTFEFPKAFSFSIIGTRLKTLSFMFERSKTIWEVLASLMLFGREEIYTNFLRALSIKIVFDESYFSFVFSYYSCLPFNITDVADLFG